MLGLFDQSIAGQLVGFLTVLAPPLTVALSGQATIAAGRFADLAEREHQVDQGHHRVRTLGLLLGAATREHHARFGLCQQPNRTQLLRDRHARQPLDERRVTGPHAALELFKALGARGNVGAIDQLLLNRQVEQAIGQCQVGPRCELQMQGCGARGIREARIDDDQLAAPLLLLEHPLHDRRHGLRAVGAPKHQRPSLGDVRDRKGQTAIDAERAVLPSRSGRHAVTPIVVDIRRFERNPRELTEQVGFLVGERPAAERADRVDTVSLLQGHDPLSDEVERGVPAHGCELAVRAAQERTEHALRGDRAARRR